MWAVREVATQREMSAAVTPFRVPRLLRDASRMSRGSWWRERLNSRWMRMQRSRESMPTVGVNGEVDG